MSLLIETIRIKNTKVENLSYHQHRYELSLKSNHPLASVVDLKELIQCPIEFEEELIKCRITYDSVIKKVEYIPYKKSNVKNLELVDANHISYDHKYADRNALKKLFNDKTVGDDILMIKNDRVTDTYYCNVAFFDGSYWSTPKHPMLYGTQRAYLLEKNILKDLVISKKDISSFEKIAMFNAMIPFDERIEINTDKIFNL